MKYICKVLVLIGAVGGGISGVGAGEDPGQAEPNPPIATRHSKIVSVPSRQVATQRYEFGEVSADEQHYIELINRARRDPLAEGKRMQTLDLPEVLRAVEFFKTDLGFLLSDPANGFQVFDVAQPLAPNRFLHEAAEVHNDDMFENTYQGHLNAAGEDAQQRIERAGYIWTAWGENVFSTSEGNLHGHAGFQIDWGIGPNGIQNPPGHRRTIHNTNFKEVGIAVRNESKDSIDPNNPNKQNVGPQLVTQVMGRGAGGNAFITGVAYYDLNGDNFYDPGEGIAGLRVETLEGTWFTETAEGGGYAIPANGDGNYTVKFTDQRTGASETKAVMAVSGGSNIKVDHVGAAPRVVLDLPQRFSTVSTADVDFESVFGAENYEWEYLSLSSGPFVEDANDGQIPFESKVASGFNPVSSRFGVNNSRSFHFFTTSNPPQESEFVWTGGDGFLLGDNPVLKFQSLQGVGTSTQVAVVSIRPASSTDWIEIWTQPGPGQVAQERNFQLREFALSEYAGQVVQIRFAYEYRGGGFIFWDQSNDPIFGSDGIGWYFDNVELSDASSLSLVQQGTTQGGTEFSIQSATTGEFGMRIRPQVSGQWFPWSELQFIEADDQPIDVGPIGPIAVAIRSVARLDANNLLVTVTADTSSQPNFQISRAAQVQGPYQQVTRIAVANGEAQGQFEITLPFDGTTDAVFFNIAAEQP